MAALPRCPICGTELPPAAPGGHCPKCLLGLAEYESPEEAVFKAALNLPASQREDYLQAACAGDAQLRAQVEALLEMVGEAVSPARTKKVSAPVMEAVGDTIGRYKLLQQIGEGGCGVVYMAEQEEPVKRRVALKVIKPGMDTKEVLARFEAERQALALMDHPNIAKVLDAGATETGRPFFVMELVRGIPVTRYCDENKLPAEQRIELFILVCQAIQHAHQKGIIHRDIKPSNVLVAHYDGLPVPKIIDFGIAKATTGQVLTNKTVFTALEQFIGTPAYMSPEQARLSAMDIDTRSDVYSLGVLLYELLTGKTPFDSKKLFDAGFDEIRRVIREEEPPRPSQKLSTLAAEDQTTTARDRQTDSPRLIHLVRGDLDWIVMKCLEKDRARRYETANELAVDLKRHLENEPVLARPPTNLYRLRKMAQRHVAAFAVAALIAAVLVAATSISAWQAARATKAEALAKERLAESEAISKFMTEVLPRPDPSRDGSTITVAETLIAAANKLDADLSRQPALRTKLQANLGATYEALGLYREAIPLQEKVRDYYLASAGLENPDTLTAMGNLAVSYDDAGRRGDARELREKVLKIRSQLLGPEHLDTLASMQDLAISYSECGRLDEALQLRRQGLALRRKALGAEHPDTLAAMESLAISCTECGRPDEALSLVEQVLAIWQKKLDQENPEPFSTNRRTAALKLEEDGLALRRKALGAKHTATLAAMQNLANSYSECGRRQEALKLREELLDLRRKALGPEHPDTLTAMQNLAISYVAFAQRIEALALREKVLAGRRKVLGPDHPDTLAALQDLANSYADFGRRDEALTLAKEVLTRRRKTLGLEHAATVAAMKDLAQYYSNFGRPEELLKLREEEVALHRQALGPENPETLAAMSELAESCFNNGRQDEALKLREDVLASRRKVLGPDHPGTLAAMQDVAVSYDNFGRRDEAVKLESELLASRRKMLGQEDPATLQSMNLMASTLARIDSADVRNGSNAVRVAEEAVALTRRTNACFLETLALAYSKTHQFQEAAAARQTAVGLARIQNASFETPVVGLTNYYLNWQCNPPGADWTFVGYAGLAANGGGFACYNAGTSNGNQFAFLQGHAGLAGSISQTLSNMAAGVYTFAFFASQRDRVGRDNTENQTLLVLADGVNLGSFTPPDTNWYSFQTAPIALDSKNHVLTFACLPVVGDATVRLDMVRITGSPSP